MSQMTWRKKVNQQIEERLSILLVDQPEYTFQNQVNEGLNRVSISGTGQGPLVLGANPYEFPEHRYWAPRIPCTGYNTPIRWIISGNLSGEDFTGEQAFRRTPSLAVQVYSGEESGNPGRNTHQSEVMQFLIHGIFRDCTRPEVETLVNPENEKPFKWLGNGYDWQKKKEGFRRIQNLDDFIRDQSKKFPEKPINHFPRWHRTMNEQSIDFVDDVQRVLNVGYMRNIRVDDLSKPDAQPISTTDLMENDAFVVNMRWGKWGLLKMDNSPDIFVTSIPLFIQVSYPKVY